MARIQGASLASGSPPTCPSSASPGASVASSIGQKLAFSAVVTLVVFGAVEAGLRGADWPQATGAFTHNEPFWTVPAKQVQEKTPHNEMGTSFPVSTDDNGLRYPIHDQDKRPGVHRVMTLGCSTTFGWGVADRESYPAALERRIRDAGHRKTEVINGGQPGYTSFQGLWLWDEVLKYYEPDVVLVGFIVQDARKAAYSDKSQAILQQDARFLKDNLLYRWRLYMMLRSLIGGFQVEAKELGAQDAGGAYRVGPEDYAANLRELVARIQDVDATPILFGYPLEREGYTATHRRILRAAAEELGVRHLDPQPQMEQASNQAELYFPRDKGHANAAGNARIADWVYDFLEQEQLLGPGDGA